MRPTALLCLLVLAVAMQLPGQPYAESPKPPRTLAEMEPVIEKIAAWEFGQSRDPLYDFSEFLQGVLASPAALREVDASAGQAPVVLRADNLEEYFVAAQDDGGDAVVELTIRGIEREHTEDYSGRASCPLATWLARRQT